MGKRKRRVRILKECNRSKRLGKCIGRMLAGVVDPKAGFSTGVFSNAPNLLELSHLSADLAERGKRREFGLLLDPPYTFRVHLKPVELILPWPFGIKPV